MRRLLLAVAARRRRTAAVPTVAALSRAAPSPPSPSPSSPRPPPPRTTAAGQSIAAASHRSSSSSSSASAFPPPAPGPSSARTREGGGGDPAPAPGGGGGGGGEARPASSGHSRLAGRRRFYRSAGVAPRPPPWEGLDPAPPPPISAVVDGADSTSGVTLARPTRGAMMEALTPRPVPLVLGPDEDESEDEAEGGGGGAEWYGVTLDSRPVRTPLGTLLSVPSSTLALALAAEWDAQKTTITPAQMPLMTLVCTTLDRTSSDPESAVQNVLGYLRNDTTCYRSDPGEDRVLARRQSRAWDGLHDWAERALGARPASAVGADEAILISRSGRRRAEAGGSPGLPHPPPLEERAEAWVRELDAWCLTALRAVTVEAKSLLVGMAVVSGAARPTRTPRGPDHREPRGPRPPPYASETRDAVLACRVEEEFQIENWGLVEGGHDYDRLNCSVGVHAATVLVSSIATDALEL